MRLTVHETDIDGVAVACSAAMEDSRGSFARFLCVDEMAAVLQGRRIVQINRSINRHVGAIRGLHFQYSPHAEMKMVRCIKGRIWDVAVDLRADTRRRFAWHAEELTPENRKMMIIPEGCAHGFQVLEPDSEVLYFHTEVYVPEAEGGIRFDDEVVDIPWPLPATSVSDKDQSLPLLTAEFPGLQA